MCGGEGAGILDTPTAEPPSQLRLRDCSTPRHQPSIPASKDTHPPTASPAGLVHGMLNGTSRLEEPAGRWRMARRRFLEDLLDEEAGAAGVLTRQRGGKAGADNVLDAPPVGGPFGIDRALAIPAVPPLTPIGQTPPSPGLAPAETAPSKYVLRVEEPAAPESVRLQSLQVQEISPNLPPIDAMVGGPDLVRDVDATSGFRENRWLDFVSVPTESKAELPPASPPADVDDDRQKADSNT